MPRYPRLRASLMILCLVASLALLVVAFGFTPPEKVMGQRIRMLYVHVGSAWTAYVAYVATAVAAAQYLRTRALRWDYLAVAAAEVGFVLTTLTLTTGSLWARSTQGWWWVWEPRLTITLLLWFLYAGYLILRQYTQGERRASVSGVLALAGIPAMVLNHFAVDMFRVMHPSRVVLRSDAPGMSSPWYWVGIAAAVIAFTLAFSALVAYRVRLEERRVALLEIAAGR